MHRMLSWVRGLGLKSMVPNPHGCCSLGEWTDVKATSLRNMSMGNVGNGDVETLLATSLSWAETSEPSGSKAARIMTNPRQISIHFEGLFRGSVLGGLAALARSRRNYAVFPLLLIDVFHLQQHLVLVNAELSLLAHRQQYWMLFVPWANTVNHAITLQQIFLTQQSVSLLVSRVGTDEFADNALTAVFVHTTLRRVHLQQGATLMDFWLFGLGKRHT